MLTRLAKPETAAAGRFPQGVPKAGCFAEIRQPPVGRSTTWAGGAGEVLGPCDEPGGGPVAVPGRAGAGAPEQAASRSAQTAAARAG